MVILIMKLLNAAGKVLSLKQLARLSVRSQMLGLRLRSRVAQLPLPNCLQDYLMYKGEVSTASCTNGR